MAITSLQLEAGGPKDLLISDVTYPEMLGIVMETVSNSLDSATFIDHVPGELVRGPSTNPPASCSVSPRRRLDGVLDLLFSPNTSSKPTTTQAHFFKNTGSNDAPLWSL